jgi:hypothetical protein
VAELAERNKQPLRDLSEGDINRRVLLEAFLVCAHCKDGDFVLLVFEELV